MSKRIDTSKIERIRDAAIKIISEQGIPNCSVAAIAKRAGVSVGYLYRHYSGKEELINDMLELYFNIINEKISSLIAEKHGVEEIVEGVILHILQISRENEARIKFLIMLLNDFSVTIRPALTARVDALAEELMIMIRNSPGIRSDLLPDDLYHAMIGLPMQYLALRYNRIISCKEPDCADTGHIVGQAMRLIKAR